MDWLIWVEALLKVPTEDRRRIDATQRPREKSAIGVLVWRNTGRGTWTDATGRLRLAAIETAPLRDVVVGDLDGDGDSDLLVVAGDGRMHVLDNDGGHVNGQLKIRLRTIKTNPNGIGAHVEVRSGTFFVTRSVGRIPIEIGLGGRGRIDAVQTIWTNGIIENTIDVAAQAAPMTVAERNIAAGSCPFLYAWDGRDYRFVTDLLGNAPVGLSLRRDVMLPADPDELVSIGGRDRLVPTGGAYRVMITDEFRELLYLDSVRLVAVDHAPDVEVHPTDKLMPPPFPTSELRAVRRSHTLLSAVGDDGVDRTQAARERDGVFTAPGPPLPPPLRGMCRPLSITLDFGTIEAARPLVLALTGWLQYGDASTNIAMSQSRDLVVIPPSLEVETAGGRWVPLDVVVGMPAGKTKTILCDLAGLLPDGGRRLRLTTTFEIRWDRIALTEGVDARAVTRRTMAPGGADLRWRGFSELVARAPGHPTTPAFDVVASRPPWRTTPQGWCTRYGDVLELVAAADSRLVIMNAGDALALEFDARALPPERAGAVRSFFLYTVGWDKDEDYNVVDGDRVIPLPGARTSDQAGPPEAPEGWRLRYNTRWTPHLRFPPDDPTEGPPQDPIDE